VWVKGTILPRIKVTACDHRGHHCCLPSLFPFVWEMQLPWALRDPAQRMWMLLNTEVLLALKPTERLSTGTETGSEVPEAARCSTGRTSTNFSTPSSQATSVPNYIKKKGCVLHSNFWTHQRVW